MKKRVISILMAFVFAVTIMPMSFVEASGSVGGTAYDEVIKSKNTVYCIGYSGLYKVTLRNNKPVKTKRLVKTNTGCGPLKMIKKGKYIYYLNVGTAAGGTVYRVNVNTGKKKKLSGYLDEGDFTIANNKLYYSKYDYSSGSAREVTYRANLNGTSRKRVSTVIRGKLRRTNASSYRVRSDYGDYYVIDYLKTPRGKFRIGKRSY